MRPAFPGLPHSLAAVTRRELAPQNSKLPKPDPILVDFIVGRTTRGELLVTEAQEVVQAVKARYPAGFVPHSMAILRRLQP